MTEQTRLRAALTAAAVADKMGVRYQRVLQLEGQARPTPEAAAKYIAAVSAAAADSIDGVILALAAVRR